MSEMLNSRLTVAGLIIIALIAGFALGGCASQAPTPNSNTDETNINADTSQPDSNNIVALDAEGAFEVYLNYNAGTGYEWQCRVEPEGTFFIARQNTKDSAEETDEPITGGSLQDIVMVRAAEAGKATLICELLRPWEEDEEPAEVQSFVFEVDDDLSMRFIPEESNYLVEPEEVFNS